MEYEKCFLYRNKSVVYFRKLSIWKLSLYIHKREFRMWFINNNYINHKLLELSVQAPKREQLPKAAALYICTQGRKS